MKNNIVQKLYLARFSLVFGALLAILPIVVICGRFGISLFGGLFDLTDWVSIAWATWFAYLLSWSATVTFKITVLYGPPRCGIETSKTGSRFIETLRASQVLFFIGLFLPVPFLVVILSETHGAAPFGGALLGFAAGFVSIVLADCVQRLFNSFEDDEEDPSAKKVFFPFQNPLSDIAERMHVTQKFVPATILQRWRKILSHLYGKYFIGYLTRRGKNVVVNPGIVLSVTLVCVFAVLYFIGYYLWQASPNSGIPAIAYVFVLFNVLCFLFAGAAFAFDRYRFPTLIVALMVLLYASQNHTYRMSFASAESKDNFVSPKDILTAREDDPYIILVSANGGGIQSSAWATEVLTRFDQYCWEMSKDIAVEKPTNQCRNAIALISGVSGGSVGSMYFMSSYNGDPQFDPVRAQAIRDYSRESSLAYVAGGIVFSDFIRNIPYASNYLTSDRGSRLARGWLENKSRIDCRVKAEGCKTPNDPESPTNKLSAWRFGVREMKRPAIIFNSTIVETGQRLLFSTTKMENHDMINPEWLIPENLQEAEKKYDDINVTDAVRLSSAFAFVTPVAKMIPEQSKTRNLADGGYADNYGLLSIRDFLADAVENDGFKTTKKPKIIVVQIFGETLDRNPITGNVRAQPDQPIPASGEAKPAPPDYFTFFDQTVAPLNLLLHVRQSSQYARNSEAFRRIQDIAGAAGYDEPNLIAFEFPNNAGDVVPLSWHLTGQDKQDIDEASWHIFQSNSHDDFTEPWDTLSYLITPSR